MFHVSTQDTAPKAALGVLLPLARGTGGLFCGWLCFAFSAASTARNAQEMKLPLPITETVNPVLQLSGNNLQRRECLHYACFEGSALVLLCSNEGINRSSQVIKLILLRWTAPIFWACHPIANVEWNLPVPCLWTWKKSCGRRTQVANQEISASRTHSCCAWTNLVNYYLKPWQLVYLWLSRCSSTELSCFCALKGTLYSQLSVLN